MPVLLMQMRCITSYRDHPTHQLSGSHIAQAAQACPRTLALHFLSIDVP
jgi:hypothetical protein